MRANKNINRNVVCAAARFREFDYGFLLEIEKVALKNMAHYFAGSDISMDDWKSARDCRIMHKLLVIACGDDNDCYNPGDMEWVREGKIHRLVSTSEATMNKYVNIGNAHRFVVDFKDSPSWRCALRECKAWYLYNKMRYHCLQGCWN